MNTPILDLNIEHMRESAAQASQFLKTLANPDRLLLLCQLSQSEMHVGALAAATGVKQPTLSQQLTVLRTEGLVATRRDGKQIYYRIASPLALAMLQLLYAQFCQVT